VIETHYRLRVFRQLFTSDETVALLNKSAIRFFTTLKWDLMDTIAITISRLTDPPKSRTKYLNASLPQLIDSIDASARPQLVSSLKAIFTQIKAKSVRIENWRRKWAAHQDFEVIQGQTPKPAMSLTEIDELLALIRKFMNEYENACQDPRVEINLYKKTAFEVKEIVENESLKIGSPTDYENMVFRDDGNTILNIIKRVNSPQ
jgi:hypothetical protein